MGRKKNLRKHFTETNEEFTPPQVIKTSKLVVEKCISLSDRDYSVFRMSQLEVLIGFFGVYPTGKYQYSLALDCINEIDIILFVESYIRKELGLTPYEKIVN